MTLELHDFYDSLIAVITENSFLRTHRPSRVHARYGALVFVVLFG
jgi:hypothetical protein